jgi:hypothetical protein
MRRLTARSREADGLTPLARVVTLDFVTTASFGRWLLAGTVLLATAVFLVPLDGWERLSAAQFAFVEARDAEDAVDVLGALLAPITEVRQLPNGLIASESACRTLRLEFDTGQLVDAHALTCDDPLEFNLRQLPRGRAWLSWVPGTSDPGVGPPMSNCGNGNPRGRLPARVTRRADGRVALQVDVTERGLEIVGVRWRVPRIDGLLNSLRH